MKLLGRNLSRRDLVLVGAALLLPVPLVALDGYAAGLPDAVGRGLGSLATLDARDDRSGVGVSGGASEAGRDTQRSGRATLTVSRAGGKGVAVRRKAPSGSAGTRTRPGTNAGQPEERPRGDASGDNGDSGSAGPSGEGGNAAPGSDPGSHQSRTPDGSPSVSVTTAGQGTATGVTAGANGVTIDLGADSARGDDPGTTVTVTDTGGSPTSVSVGGPDSVVSRP
jgi:hypothetical protein